MAVTGRTGADATFQFLKHICHTITRYRAKLDAVIDAAATAGAITQAQATTAHDFVATAGTLCGIFELVAGYSGFYS